MTTAGQPIAAGRLQRISAFLADDRSYWWLAAAVFGVVAFFKGFRLPNSWAATQAQFGYDHGFAKRALFGALLTRPLHLWIYGRFAFVATALLLALMAALVLFTRRSGARDRVTPGAAAAVFFSSYTITFLAYMNGMFDIPEALLCLLLLCLRNPLVRLIAGLPVVALALLTHEMFLLVYAPVLLLSFVLNAATETESRRARLALLYGALLAIFAGIATLVIAKQPSFTVAQVLAYQQEIQQRADFPLQTTFYLVLARSTADNLRLMATFVSKPSWWTDILGGLVTVLPMMLFLLALVRRMLRQATLQGRRWVFPACLAASCAPLSMNLVGFDVGRWWALSGLTTFLVFCLVCGYVPGPGIRLGTAALRIAMMIVALNMACGDGLIDPGSTIQAFPYTTEIKQTMKTMLQHQRP